MCSFSNIDKETYAIRFIQHLKGEALNCVYAMNNKDREDFQLIKAGLLKWISFNREGCRIGFNQVLPEQSMDLKKYCTQIQKGFADGMICLKQNQWKNWQILFS